MIDYHGFGAIKRTFPRRPVLMRRPLGLYDPQALPPRAWCVRCGAEVYKQSHDLCPRCLQER